jgi:hypothetical protein
MSSTSNHFWKQSSSYIKHYLSLNAHTHTHTHTHTHMLTQAHARIHTHIWSKDTWLFASWDAGLSMSSACSSGNLLESVQDEKT